MTSLRCPVFIQRARKIKWALLTNIWTVSGLLKNSFGTFDKMCHSFPKTNFTTKVYKNH